MIVLGSDHAGYPLKRRIAAYLEERGLAYTDIGTLEGERGDYPVFALKAARMVVSGQAERGLLFCGTGIGISIAANKVKGIRCAVCSEPYSARLTSAHNAANMLALGARVVGDELAVMIVEAWLDTPFEGGRHQERLDYIARIEAGEE